MKTAAEIADTLRWCCHAATVFVALWLAGSTLDTPIAVAAILTAAGADYGAARGWRWLADWLTSHTHV